MYYKVESDTELFDKLQSLSVKITEAKKEAENLAEKEFDFQYEGVCNKSHSLGGGIGAVKCPSKPEGWKNIPKNPGFYFPKKTKQNKSLLKQISSLPTVEIKELTELLGMNGGLHHTKGLGFFTHPGVVFGNDFHLIKFPDGYDYKPVDGMVEITASEYNTLNDKNTNQ